MKTYKLTTPERERIRSWLEKRPESSDIPKVWDFERDNGTVLQISRSTQYFGSEWKTRTAFIVDSNFPLMMSGPIKAGTNIKPPSKSQPKKVVFQVHTDAKKKAMHANKGAFVKAIDAEMHALKQQVHEYVNKPSPVLDALFSSAYPDDYLLPECPACGEPGCVCYEG